MEFQSITLFLTDFSAAELEQLESFKHYSDSSSVVELADDWQLEFAKHVGIKGHTIPWNLLRASHFNLPKNTRTIVCCDPVMMQMTHRGAYLLGQQELDFSQEDVIRIVANINEILMREGESFHLLNNQQWLFTSEKEIELNLPSFESYIGKDMFGFSYPGKNGVWWDKLAIEIQMLIKQMTDYLELATIPAEHLINVHFWGNTKARLVTGASDTANSSHIIVSNDSQYESLSHFYKIRFNTIDKIDQVIKREESQPSRLSVIISRKDGFAIDVVFEKLVKLVSQNKLRKFRIVAADKQILLKEKEPIWRKLLNIVKT